MELVDSGSLRKNLKHRLSFNQGTIPCHKPSNIEDIRNFRVLIAALRSAEIEYLSPKSTPEERESAERFLFGFYESPLPVVCRLLGIDRHAARIKVLEWKMKGLVGDPIFGYLAKPSSLNRFENGQPLDVPNLTKNDER